MLETVNFKVDTFRLLSILAARFPVFWITNRFADKPRCDAPIGDKQLPQRLTKFGNTKSVRLERWRLALETEHEPHLSARRLPYFRL